MGKVVLSAIPVAGLLLVLFLGPWPTYDDDFQSKHYFKKNIAAIDESAKAIHLNAAPGALQAGWAVRSLDPGFPVPMAGYGARRGALAQGVHDPVNVKAMALSDGEDTVVIIGADMLIIPENVADMVREEVTKQTPLTANSLYFGASHTHDSIGGFAPGLAAFVTGGPYVPEVPPFLVKQFSEVIVEAYKNLKPAKLAHGSVDAAQFIHNRAREAGVDSELSYIVVEQEGGNRCYLVSFSAHPTNVDSDVMQMTSEYPGALQRSLEDANTTAMYLGGALGSMGPHAPEGENVFDRVEAMGKGLAELVKKDLPSRPFEDHLDVASVGASIELPPLQMRVMSTKWRLSKFAGPLAGLDTDGWVHGVRVGPVVWVGMPGDFSGEISAEWKKQAEKDGYDLWVTSFCADYAGYISPDKYYSEVKEKNGEIAYETAFMSWTGPHQEAFFAALKDRMVAHLMGRATS